LILPTVRGRCASTTCTKGEGRAYDERVMPRRDKRIVLGLVVLSMLCAVGQWVSGASPDLLLAVPALLLFLPLLGGRYLGEDSLARLAVTERPRRRRRASSWAQARRAPRVLARGGRLIAESLAERGPPAPLPAR
jgi:hypothetical protein